MLAQTFGRLCKRLPTLGIIQSNGNCLIQAGYSPKIESGYTLSDILQDVSLPSSSYFHKYRLARLIPRDSATSSADAFLVASATTAPAKSRRL